MVKWEIKKNFVFNINLCAIIIGKKNYEKLQYFPENYLKFMDCLNEFFSRRFYGKEKRSGIEREEFFVLICI